MFVKLRLAEFFNAGQRSITGGVEVDKVTDCINIDGSVCASQRADCPFEFPAGQPLTIGGYHIPEKPNLFPVEIPLVFVGVIGNAKRLLFLCHVLDEWV